MKSNFFKSAILLMITMVISVAFFASACAQDVVPPVNMPTEANAWFNPTWVEYVYGVVIIIGGYLSAFIPGLKNINAGVYRVLTWAVLTGSGAIYLGSDVWGVAITYFMATGLYNVVLKLIIRSPQPKDQYGRTKDGKIEPLIS